MLKEQTVFDHTKSKFKPTTHRPVMSVPKGISRHVVELISAEKHEPKWMLKKRLRALEIFESKPMPTWGPDLSGLDFNDITFYIDPSEQRFQSWDDVPDDIKRVYDRIGVPEAEKKFLAGVVAQYESEGLYNHLKAEWSKLGVIFCSMDEAVQKYPDLVKEHFMTRCVPAGDNKFSALHGAVWSGGAFLYVPRGVDLKEPVQTYFFMNAETYGQFEHTLIIVEEGASAHYIEGCTAPHYGRHSLHSAVVEIFVKKGAKVRYTTIQNWSTDVYNLNTKRALVGEDGQMEWVGGSLGSGVTMLYPCSMLMGRGAKADHLNIAIAGPGQHKDTGAKVVHGAPDTSSTVLSKSISIGGGVSSYRGLTRVVKGAKNAKAKIQCDALLMDNKSQANTWPHLYIYEPEVTVGHEAATSRIEEEQLFYLQSRGLSAEAAVAMIVNGFLEPIVRELPLEYAVELNRLIAMEMEGSVG